MLFETDKIINYNIHGCRIKFLFKYGMFTKECFFVTAITFYFLSELKKIIYDYIQEILKFTFKTRHRAYGLPTSLIGKLICP